MNRTVAGLMLALVAVIGGCPHPEPAIRLDPIPLRDAARIVNANIQRIRGCLRATGSVDGYATDDGGRRRNYHLDGTLFYLEPDYLRFDLKKFGDRQLLLGCNEESFWVYLKQEDAYFCGIHGEPGNWPPEFPARPDQMAAALGLIPIPINPGPEATTRIGQRVVDDFQQIIFAEEGADGRLVFVREYWIDRSPPQLVRRVIFRDTDGVVEMESRLENYGLLQPGGPQLPGLMIATWPKLGSSMKFSVGRWTCFEQIGPDAIQFTTPTECIEP